IPAEQKRWGTKKHQTLQRSSRERPNFHVTGKHVAHEGIASCAGTAIAAGICRTEIGIRLIVRWCDVELGIAPHEVLGEEKTAPVLRSRNGILRPQRTGEQYNHGKSDQPLHRASAYFHGVLFRTKLVLDAGFGGSLDAVRSTEVTGSRGRANSYSSCP